MNGSLKRNLVVGVAAGVAGTALMNVFFQALKKWGPESSTGRDEEPPTVKVAKVALKAVGVHAPSKQTRVTGGNVVHWGYGVGWGALAGAARAAGVPVTWGGGVLFGTGLWALGDLWMLYQLDLAKHPREYPKQVHAGALGAHLAYGAGVWATMAALRKRSDKASEVWRGRAA